MHLLERRCWLGCTTAQLRNGSGGWEADFRAIQILQFHLDCLVVKSPKVPWFLGPLPVRNLGFLRNCLIVPTQIQGAVTPAHVRLLFCVPYKSEFRRSTSRSGTLYHNPAMYLFVNTSQYKAAVC
jgi:hypothetical protein